MQFPHSGDLHMSWIYTSGNNDAVLTHLDTIAPNESLDGGEDASVILLHGGSSRGPGVLHFRVLPLSLGGAGRWGGARLLRCFAHSQPHCPKSHM